MGTSLSAPTVKRWLRALWLVLPREQLHPTRAVAPAVPYVHYDVMCGLKVYTRHDALAEGRREALPTQAPPPPPRAWIGPPSRRHTSGAS